MKTSFYYSLFVINIIDFCLNDEKGFKNKKEKEI